ncbi:hypothetical protein EV714DRAFT_278011 [Schizophyllum commune]
MPTSSPLGLPLAQSSTCRHAITASDLVGPHEYAGDVAPAEERCRSSQSHTCKPNLLEDTHLPFVLVAFLRVTSSLSIGEYADLLPSYFFGTRTSTPRVISLVSYECISMLGFYYHTRDDSDDGCNDARYTADGCDNARYTADTAANTRDPTDAADARDSTDAADARDPTDAADDACCLADARTT